MKSEWQQRRTEFLQQITIAQEDLFFLELDEQVVECWGGDGETGPVIKARLDDCRAQIDNLSKLIASLDRLYAQH